MKKIKQSRKMVTFRMIPNLHKEMMWVLKQNKISFGKFVEQSALKYISKNNKNNK